MGRSAGRARGRISSKGAGAASLTSSSPSSSAASSIVGVDRRATADSAIQRPTFASMA